MTAAAVCTRRQRPALAGRHERLGQITMQNARPAFLLGTHQAY